MPASQLSQQSLPTVPAIVASPPTSSADPVGEPQGTQGALSPRDTVWKRYFSENIPAGEPQTAPEPVQSCRTAINQGGPIVRPGVPRLPLPSQGPQLGSSATLPPTERNHPATARSHPTGHQLGPSRHAGTVAAVAAVACVATTPSLPQETAGTQVQVDREQIRLSEVGSQYALDGPSSQVAACVPPAWSSAALSTARSQENVAHNAPQPSATSGNVGGGGVSSLQHTMGQFGPPDPPVAIDMATVLPLQGASGHSDRMLGQETPARPQECAAQSFAPATSPARKCEDETFAKSAGLWPTVQAGSDCPEKQIMDVARPLRGNGAKGAAADAARGCLRGAGGAENNQPNGQLHDRAAASTGDPADSHKPTERRERSHTRQPQETSGGAQGRRSPSRPRQEKAHSTELEAAAAAVNLRDLAELRSFRNPPLVVCQVLEPVAMLLSVSDTRWPRMRKLLDGNLLGRLSAFDPTSLTAAQIDRVAALLQAPAFSDGNLNEKCPAAVSLATWCTAVMRHVMSRPGGGYQHAPVDDLPAGQPGVGGIIVEPNVWVMSDSELARVPGLRLTREGVGSIYFQGETDLRDALPHLADVVMLQPGEVVVYPNPGSKPPVGVGLNKAAEITLYGCMPKTQGFPDQKAKERYRKRVKQMTEDKGAEFVDYDCTVGTWKFRVHHF